MSALSLLVWIINQLSIFFHFCLRSWRFALHICYFLWWFLFFRNVFAAFKWCGFVVLLVLKQVAFWPSTRSSSVSRCCCNRVMLIWTDVMRSVVAVRVELGTVFVLVMDVWCIFDDGSVVCRGLLPSFRKAPRVEDSSPLLLNSIVPLLSVKLSLAFHSSSQVRRNCPIVSGVKVHFCDC